MSLKDPDEEYEDLVPEKHKGKVGKAASKAKIFGIVLVIGLILGVIAGHYFVEPLISEAETNVCKDCLSSKELLSKENDCLYKSVSDPIMAMKNCTAQAISNDENPPETP